MSALPNLAADARVLLQLLRGQASRGSHAERLQAFYAPQADRYDSFRTRLLHGREELISRMELEPGMRVVELGCGTGSSLDAIGPVLDKLAHYDMVDLCPALLAHARRRAEARPNVAVHEADAANWRPTQPVDRIFIAYALTMIPDWSTVIDSAKSMLGLGGKIGVVDFHLPAGGRSNGLWRRWFAHDGVLLSAEHLSRLRDCFPDHWLCERRAPLPYLTGLSAPYYIFVGRRP